MADAFSFELVSPERLVLSGDATAVLIPGAEGYFEVMANHAPVMSTIKPGVVEVKMAEGETSKIFVRGGFADVSPAGCTLLAEYARDLKDFDMSELDEQIKNAQDDLNDADSDAKRDVAEKALNELKQSKDAIKMAS